MQNVGYELRINLSGPLGLRITTGNNSVIPVNQTEILLVLFPFEPRSKENGKCSDL